MQLYAFIATAVLAFAACGDSDKNKNPATDIALDTSAATDVDEADVGDDVVPDEDVAPDDVAPDDVAEEDAVPEDVADEDMTASDTATPGDTDEDAADDVAASDTSTEVVEPQAVEYQGWTIVAETPTLAGGEVSASMTLTRESGAETRGGGLCLVTQLTVTPCTTSDDCAELPLPEGGFHYCEGVNGAADKHCWTRPGDGTLYCSRSPSRTPGEHTVGPVPALVNGADTVWMTLVCIADEGNAAGCASPDPEQRRYVTSPTLFVPAPEQR